MRPAETSVEQSGLLPAADVARWVRGGAWLALGGYIVSIMVGTMVVPGPFASRIGEIGVVVVAGLALLFVDAGRVRLAGTMILGAVWFEVHFSLIWDGLVAAPGIAAFPALITLGALYSGRRLGFTLAASTLVSLPLVTRLHHLQAGIPGWATGPEVGFWVLVPVICFATAVLMGLGLESLGRAVAEARESRARYADLVARVPDGVLTFDDAGVVRTLNPAARRIFGWREDELGKHRTDEVPVAGLGTLADLLAQVEVDESRRVTLVLPNGRRRVELRVRPPSESPLVPGSDRLLILRDLSELVDLEHRLTQFGALIENSREEVYVFSSSTGAIRLMSRGARIAIGLSPDDPPPARMEQVNPALSPEGFRALLTEADGDEVPIVRGVHRRVDGAVYPVEVRLQRSELGGEAVAVAFATDIRRQLEAEEAQEQLRAQLEHAQRMEAIGQLAGGVAHDFNNLLTVMAGYADALREEVGPAGVEMIDGLLEAQERGGQLTQRLLAFARKEVARPTTLDLRALLEAVRPLAAHLVRSPARVEFELGAEALPMTGDRGQIEQVLLNLVTNARDANPRPDGVVRVRSFVDEAGAASRVGFEVMDDGRGMEPDVVERMFDPFFTTKPKGKGTGLGLSTVRAIVDESGGAIEVDTDPGQGTRMRISWPRATSGPVPELAEDATDSGPARILFAEDDDQGRELVARMLERAGHSVVRCRDGESALARFDADPAGFDLVVTDVVMPGISGIELADRVGERAPGLPVLLVSGYLDDHLTRAQTLGDRRELLLKPFRPDELLARVRRMLAHESAGPNAG